ncbi:MAG: DUF1592 domain-containing protein [Myxococcota bacterium]
MSTLLLPLALLAGCGPARGPEASPDPDEPAVPFAPAVATMHRLTDLQWRHSVEALTGVEYGGPLPSDYALHGYTRVGASQATVSPLELEQYEFAAWEVAAQAVPDAASAADLVGCDPTETACLRVWASDFGSQAWRRPLVPSEIDRLAWVFDAVEPELGEAVAVQAVVATLLLAPDFTFRVEIGTPHPDQPGVRVFTDWEMASRLAYVLTDRPPDALLAAAAAEGTLTTDAGLREQAERLLSTPQARQVMQDWFAETLDLDKVHSVDKDPLLFPELTTDLRWGMELEIRQLFDWVVFEERLPYNTLLTTNTTFADRDLAALYGMHFSNAGVQQVNLAEGQERGGLLGRAAILAIHAHNTQTSPTHRGKFVRTRLLCQSIPPPPPGVVTELAPPTEGGTLRDRLEQHAIDPQCSGCHQIMDPIGFGMEAFDPIGRRRELDNGLPVDATGVLDGKSFDGARELGQIVAEHPELPVCTALSLYRFANGQAETEAELPLVDRLAADFVSTGQLLDELVLDLVLSEGFRTARLPEGAPDVPPADLPFEPPTPLDPPEEPDPFEVCNGLDDDANGLVDDGLEVSVTTLTATELQALGHPDCNASFDPMSPACFAANHRYCAATDCAATGYGPVDETGLGFDVVCLDATEATVVNTTFTELSTHHDQCNASQRLGPACNAAISRFCASQGLVSGYGPVENSGDTAVVTCTPGATTYQASYTEMSAHAALCDGSTERWGESCNRAAHRWCAANGHESGFGPLENSGDLFVVACVGGTP